MLRPRSRPRFRLRLNEISRTFKQPNSKSLLGQKFALMEEKVVLSWFFRRYRIKADLGWTDNIPITQVITVPSRGFPVKIYKR